MKTPYFYIIRHTASGIRYAGAKRAINANPETFMTLKGYQTSSNTIHNIIKNEGLGAFIIEDIVTEDELKTPFGCRTVYEYESWFLESNECDKSNDWYNKVPPWHAAIGTDEFYNNTLNKYGVKQPGQIDTHGEKAKKTNRLKYGVDNYCQSEECKTKLLAYIHSFDENAVNVWQLDIVKAKSKMTCLANHGVEHPAQSSVLFDKMKKSLLEKHGVDSPMKSDDIKKLHRNSCRESLGVDSPMQSEAVVAKYKKNFFDKYGVYYPSQIKFYCGQCNRTSTGVSNINKHHKNHQDVVLLLSTGDAVYTKHMTGA